MKFRVLSFVVTIMFSSIIYNANAQTNIDSLGTVTVDSAASKRLKFGMGFGFSFVGGTNISLSPNLMYRVSDKVSVGAGLQFNYLGIKNLQRSVTYGANVLAFYTPVNKLLTTLEFVQLKVNRKILADNMEDDFWDTALFVGAGYQITPKISAGAKYNVLYNEDKSIYSSPVVPFVNITF